MSRNQLWSTDSLLLPYVRSEIESDIPERNGGEDGVVIVDIREKPGTPIKETVLKNVVRLGIKPNITISCKVAGNKITDAAQAFSVAEEISRKIISLDFCKKVHLFFAVPKALATLVGFFLSTTLNSELCFYFLNEDRTNYLNTGCINKKTF